MIRTRIKFESECVNTCHPLISARVACLTSIADIIELLKREILEESQSLYFSIPDRYVWN